MRLAKFEIVALERGRSANLGLNDDPSCPYALNLGRAAAVLDDPDGANPETVYRDDLAQSGRRAGACRWNRGAAGKRKGDQSDSCFHWTKLRLSLMHRG
jgi:hypothetical protein